MSEDLENASRIQIIREEVKQLCGNCERLTEDEFKEKVLGLMAFGFSAGLTVDRPQEWIPCSERLPDEDGQYIVWAVIGIVPDHVDDLSTYQGITIAGYYGNAYPIKWLGNVEKVLAWMPLPDPWKGENDEGVDSN